MQVTVNCNYQQPALRRPDLSLRPARDRAARDRRQRRRDRRPRHASDRAAPSTRSAPSASPTASTTACSPSRGTRVDVDPARLPCELDACYVNLVADAHNRAGSPRRPDHGRRPATRTGTSRRIAAGSTSIRYRDARPSEFPTLTTSERLRIGAAPGLPSPRRLLAPARRPARRRAAGGRGDDHARHLAPALRPARQHPPDPRRLAPRDPPERLRQEPRARSAGEISENNGSNCTQDERLCTTRKVGVVEMRRDAVTNSRRAGPALRQPRHGRRAEGGEGPAARTARSSAASGSDRGHPVPAARQRLRGK